MMDLLGQHHYWKFKHSKTMGFSRLQELKQLHLAFGGEYYWTSFTGATEEYNGTTWATSPGSLNTTRLDSLAGAGIQTSAALAFGGDAPTVYRSNRRI
jgi:hypothetical protein